MNIVIRSGLPLSHKWKTAILGNNKYRGIIWNKRDVKCQDAICLYRGWSKIHFESSWYELAVQKITIDANTSRDILKLRTILRKNRSDPELIVDIHCGSGRHVFKMHDLGYHIIGMEGAKLLRENAISQTSRSRLNIDFYPTTEKYKRLLAHKADVVTTFFNSMGYTFSSNDEIKRMKWIGGILKPNGVWIIDIRSGEYQIQHYSNARVENENIELLTNTTNINQHVRIRTLKLYNNKTFGAEETITVKGLKNPLVLQRTTYGWQTYTLDDLNKLLNAAGLYIKAIYGDYYTNAANNGERLFIVAAKY